MKFSAYVSGLTPEAETILQSYMDTFSNGNSEIVPLQAYGLKGTVSRMLSNPTTFMIIMDESFYSQLTNGYTPDPKFEDKIYVFTTEEELETMLISKVGCKVEVGTAPPDMFFNPGMTYTATADLSQGIAYDEEKVATLEGELEKVREALDKSKKEVERLNRMIESNGVDDTTRILADTVKELNVQVETLTEENNTLKEAAKRATNFEAEASKSSAIAKKVKEEKALLEHDLSTAKKSAQELKLQIDALNKDIEGYKADISDRDDEIKRVRNMLSSTGDTESKVAELNADLSSARAEADALRSQLANAGDASATAADLTSKLQAAVKERDSLNVDLETAKKSVAALKKSLDEANALCKEKEDKIAALNTKNTDLSSKVSTLTSKVSSLQTELEKTRADMNNLLTSHESSNLDVTNKLNEYQTQVDLLTNERDVARGRVDALTSDLADVKGKLHDETSAHERDSSALQSQINDLSDRVTLLNTDLENKSARIQELEADLTAAKASVASSSDTASKSNARIQKLETDLSNARSDIASRDSEIGLKTRELELLKQNYEDQKTSLDRITSTVEGLKADLQAKTQEARKLSLDLQTKESEASVASSANTRIIEEKNQIDARLVELERSVEMYRTNNTELENKLTTLKASYDTLVNDKLTLEAEKGKLDTEVIAIRTELVDMKAKTIDATMLKEQVDKLSIELAKTAAERTSLKAQLEGSTLSGLNSENMTLKAEVEKLRKKVGDTTELENSRNEVLTLRAHITSLTQEMESLRTRAMTAQGSGSLFTGGGDIIPNGVCNQTLRNAPQGYLTNFKLFLPGSADSSRTSYEVLMRACSATKKRVLLLDLTTDSSIDAAFGIKAAPSPLAWLTGESDFKNFLAATRYNNVNAITTALGYVNKLYFAQIDWTARLADLNGFADLCVIVLDGLGDYVVKAMYNTFSQIMESYVVVDSAPTNLRAAYMNVMGVSGSRMPNSNILCVKFNSSSAMVKQLYGLFTKKNFRARAMVDSEVLTL